MENIERELIQKIIPSHRELRMLYEEHLELEEQIAWFERRNFITPTEEMKLKLLKRKKLLGVERMLALADLPTSGETGTEVRRAA